MCLRVWYKILVANRGISLAFVLNSLQRCTDDIFVDASTEWGIGGCCGSDYFAYPWSKLAMFEVDVIARKELLACLVGLHCFHEKVEGTIVTIYTDNSNVASWLEKGRVSNNLGMRLLGAWEFQKYKLRCKVSARWLPGSHNTTADSLSRGNIPAWLARRGVEQRCNLHDIAITLSNVERSWTSFVQ